MSVGRILIVVGLLLSGAARAECVTVEMAQELYGGRVQYSEPLSRDEASHAVAFGLEHAMPTDWIVGAVRIETAPSVSSEASAIVFFDPDGCGLGRLGPLLNAMIDTILGRKES